MSGLAGSGTGAGLAEAVVGHARAAVEARAVVRGEAALARRARRTCAAAIDVALATVGDAVGARRLPALPAAAALRVAIVGGGAGRPLRAAKRAAAAAVDVGLVAVLDAVEARRHRLPARAARTRREVELEADRQAGGAVGRGLVAGEQADEQRARAYLVDGQDAVVVGIEQDHQIG